MKRLDRTKYHLKFRAFSFIVFAQNLAGNAQIASFQHNLVRVRFNAFKK